MIELAFILELERQLYAAEITPEAAVKTYCTEITDKQQDAFCSCPEEAVKLLRQQLKQHFTN